MCIPVLEPVQRHRATGIRVGPLSTYRRQVMSKFQVHTQVSLLGSVPIGGAGEDTDSEVAARFYVLSSLARNGQEGPAIFESHVHTGLVADREEDLNQSTALLLASAISGEPFDVWAERGQQFKAEHDGEAWQGLAFDADTNTVSLALSPEKETQLKEAQEAVNGVDDEWASFLADASVDTADTRDEDTGEH